LWFVFTVGLRAGKPVNGIPFILWLTAGLIPWYFFSESISKGVIAIKESSYIVMNMPFRLEILPIVKVLSSLTIHSFFLLVMLVMLSLFHPSNFFILWPQLIYYIFCMIILTMSINLITSSIFVFIRDVSEIVKIGLNFAFWLTPIIWNDQALSPTLKFLFRLNPVGYIVRGYRDTLLYGKVFWADLSQMVSFWAITLVLMLFSIYIFKKLRPHFADML